MPILVAGDPGTFSLTIPFDFPYFGGTVAPIAPPLAPYSVSIGGHNYLVDTSFEPYRREAFRHRSIQAQKSNITVNNEPGEGTVDDQSLWRRIAEDWSLGSGQLYFDRRNSVDNRFRQSKGVDIFTQWNMTLLNDTLNVYDTMNDVVIPCMAGAYLYVLDGNTIKFTSDLGTWTTVSGAPPDATDITTNGTDVWVASPTQGLFHTTAGEAGFDNFMATGPMTYVGFTGDRLMCSQGPALFNILNDITPIIANLNAPLTAGTTITSLVTSATTADISDGDSIVVWFGVNNQTFIADGETGVGALGILVQPALVNFSYPSGPDGTGANVGDVQPLWTNPDPNWIWNDFQYGSAEIYISGYTNSTPPGTGAVYRTTTESNTDVIDLIVPVIALPLEGGEYPTVLGSYLNLIFVGTNLGLRMCETLALYDPTGNAGDLKSGPLLPSTIEPVTKPVTGCVGNGRFVWFTWNDYDDHSTGLGRCDLSHFIDELAPAYASDLMIGYPGTPAQGNLTLDWCTISNSPVMGLPGFGLYVAAPQLVPRGTIDSGLITYGIPDNKIAMVLNARTNGQGVTSAQVSVEPLITPDFATDAVAVAPATDTYGMTTTGQALANWSLPQLTGEFFEIRLTLENPGEIEAPTVSRWMLQSIPGVTAGTEISVVIALFRTGEEKGLLAPFDFYKEYMFLENLRLTQTPTTYVNGPLVAPVVTVDSLDWLPTKEEDGTVARGFEGDIVVYLKTWTPMYLADIPAFVS